MTDIRSETLRDTDIELALIGACLVSDQAITDARDIVDPGDFNPGMNANAFRAILEVAKHGRVDVITVADHMGDDQALKFLHEAQNSGTYTPSQARRYATRIADYTLRRQLMVASHDIAMLAKGDIPSDDAGDAAQKARDKLADLDLPQGMGAPDPDADSFIAGVPMEYDWLFPGFLEHRDRMIVTASEGGGKSMLLTQIAVMAAAGIHPWTHERVKPVNAAIIDLENSPRMVSRRIATMRQACPSDFDPNRLRVRAQPEGINLTSRADRRWLMDRCRANATQLLVIGPLYRMASGVAERGDTGGEDQARKITAALDEIRTRLGVTLILETHAPHADGHIRNLRPFGSTVWLRWPEFGIGLRRSDENDNVFELSHWRGPRDERTWPKRLNRAAGAWPWMPSGMPNGTFNNRRSA